MKNITTKSCLDDLAFVKKSIDDSSKKIKPFLTGPRALVEAAISDYKKSIANGTSKPIGLKKGKPKIKAQKEKKDKQGNVITPAINSQPAVYDSHEYYYALYDSRRKFIVNELKALTKEYFGHACPYCGIDTVSHVDHYLPRSAFPEFSISLQNLVMACDGCNSTYKGDQWGIGKDKKVFHPAFDTLPVNAFLVAKCSYGNKTITVNFSIKKGNLLIDRHFLFMNLNERYIAKATLEEIPKMKKIIDAQTCLKSKIEELKSFTKQQITAYDINSCQGAFYRAVQPLVDQIASSGL